MARFSLTSAKPWWLLFGLGLALWIVGLLLVIPLGNYPHALRTESILTLGQYMAIVGGILLLIAFLAIPVLHGLTMLGWKRFVGLLAGLSVVCIIVALSLFFSALSEDASILFAFLLIWVLMLAYGYSSLAVARIFLRASATPHGGRLVLIALSGAALATIFPLLFGCVNGSYDISLLPLNGLWFGAMFVTFFTYLKCECRFPLPESPNPVANRAFSRSIVAYYILLCVGLMIIFTPEVSV